MVFLNYYHRKTVEFVMQVRVAQIDRIEAQLPRSSALVEWRAFQLDRAIYNRWQDLQALRLVVKTRLEWIERQPIELVTIESKMQLFRRRTNQLKVSIDRLLMYLRSVERKLAPIA